MNALRFCLLILVHVQCALTFTDQSLDDGDVCTAGAACQRSLLQAPSRSAMSMVMRLDQRDSQTSSDASMVDAGGQEKLTLTTERCPLTAEESREKANQVPLTDAGFQAVQQYCCPLYMQEFIRRVVTEKSNGQVCVEGALSGFTAWFYCNDGQVSGLDWSNLLQEVDPSGRAGGGDCPWVGASGSSCPLVVHCSDFPGLTHPPCQHTTSTPLTLTTAPAPVVTTLQTDAEVGDTRLDVASSNGFAVGDSISVDAGTNIEETREISGFGSILFSSPLIFKHTAGCTIAKITTTTSIYSTTTTSQAPITTTTTIITTAITTSTTTTTATITTLTTTATTVSTTTTTSTTTITTTTTTTATATTTTTTTATTVSTTTTATTTTTTTTTTTPTTTTTFATTITTTTTTATTTTATTTTTTTTTTATTTTTTTTATTTTTSTTTTTTTTTTTPTTTTTTTATTVSTTTSTTTTTTSTATTATTITTTTTVSTITATSSTTTTTTTTTTDDDDVDDDPPISTPPAVCSGCSAPNSVGPILAVYVKYDDGTVTHSPSKSISQIQDLMYGPTPNFGDVVNFSSWGQSTVTSSDIDFITTTVTQDPDTWSIYTARSSIYQTAEYQAAILSRTYTRVMGFLAGSSFAATAFINGEFSRYRSTAITWMTIAHEIGHNWGISHADCFSSGHPNELAPDGYHQYYDDAIMGYQRTWREPDYTAVARYNLGWITTSQTADYPNKNAAKIRALNEGPKATDAYLVFTIPCATCYSGNPTSSVQGGHLFISFRVEDASNIYGVENQPCVEYKNPSRTLTLVNRVHVHYQSTGERYTVLWSTMNQGETFEPPLSNVFISACKISLGGSEETAHVGISETSLSEAQSRCNNL